MKLKYTFEIFTVESLNVKTYSTTILTPLYLNSIIDDCKKIGMIDEELNIPIFETEESAITWYTNFYSNFEKLRKEYNLKIKSKFFKFTIPEYLSEDFIVLKINKIIL